MLTEAQKIEAHALMGIQYGDKTSNLQQFISRDFIAVLDGLSPAQESLVSDILLEYAKVKFATGRLNGDFEDDPDRKRQNLKKVLISTTGFNPEEYGLGRNSLRLGRG